MSELVQMQLCVNLTSFDRAKPVYSSIGTYTKRIDIVTCSIVRLVSQQTRNFCLFSQVLLAWEGHNQVCCRFYLRYVQFAPSQV